MQLSPRITITDIAEQCGVSIATVSLVLRDKPGISAETRKRVLTKAQALGYIHETPAGVSSTPAVGNIGLLIKTQPHESPMANQFYAPVLVGIESFCRQQHINLFYAHMLVKEDNTPLEIPRLIHEDSLDGLLFVGAMLTEQVLALLQNQALPIVLVDAYAENHEFDAVVSDNQQGAYTITSYLIHKGHKHIALVGSLPQAYPSIQERQKGYIEAVMDYGLPIYLVNCPLTPADAAQAVQQFLPQHPQVTALVGCNDEVAIACLQVAQAHGRRVPQDLAVVGYDDIMLAQHMVPGLTTMHVDKVGMGRLAAQLLLNRIYYPQSAKISAIIRPSLIERQSTL